MLLNRHLYITRELFGVYDREDGLVYRADMVGGYHHENKQIGFHFYGTGSFYYFFDGNKYHTDGNLWDCPTSSGRYEFLYREKYI